MVKISMVFGVRLSFSESQIYLWQGGFESSNKVSIIKFKIRRKLLISKLLAIVEVEKDSRIICQSEGCGKSVYKRIHVVYDNNQIVVLGQTCFSRIYGGNTSIFANGNSYYTGKECRKLTTEERNLLFENTQKLVEQFENEKEQLQEEKKINSTQNDVISMNPNGLPLRDVKCLSCKRPMKTHAKSVPAVGYKCEACLKENRGMPLDYTGRSGENINGTCNSREKITGAGNLTSYETNREQAEAYKNIRG